MDIRPPKGRVRTVNQSQLDQGAGRVGPLPPARAPVPPVASPSIQAVPLSDIDHSQHTRRPRPVWRWVLSSVALLLLGGIGGMYWWYNEQLRPMDSNDHAAVKFVVAEGAHFSDIATHLRQRGLIRNELAFEIYATIAGKKDALKAGTCSLKRSETSEELLQKLTAGCHDFRAITFFPGGTIEKPLYKPSGALLSQTMYVKYVLQHAGYSDGQIAAAFQKQYTGPLFAGKPAGMTLEGYIFGETYYMPLEATADQVLEESFKHFYAIVQKNDLEAKFKAHGLTLYQGITLASIVQRELNCEDKPTPERKARCYGYQQEIAQVFLKRLQDSMPLGSDVTFIYAADMMGVAPTPELESPYNTRIHAGLPPGPIASPGEMALQAVANPSSTDYLFFLAGDDGLIYFARTNAEHESNAAKYCKTLCEL